MTSSLSDTFAPPRIATNGRSGRRQRLAEVRDLVGHQQAGRRLRHEVRDALGRGVRAMRRAERVVHVDVGERRQLLRERRVVLLLLGVEADVLEQHDDRPPSPAPAAIGRFGAGSADAVVGEHDRAAEQLRQPRRDRLQAELRARAALRAGRGARRG